jgi:hypothetical protein
MTTKTFKGQTAGGIIKTAKIIKTRAGYYKIAVKTRDGDSYSAILGERIGFDGWPVRDALVLINETSGECDAIMVTSVSAYQRIAQLERELCEIDDQVVAACNCY